MKRLAVALGGFLWGLFLTWASLYTLSHMRWPVDNEPASGCRELDHCPTQWWTYPILFVLVFGPSMVFLTVNAVAWQRWPMRRWATVFASISVFAILFYLGGYLAPGVKNLIK